MLTDDHSSAEQTSDTGESFASDLPGGWKVQEKIGESSLGTVCRARRKVNGVDEEAALTVVSIASITTEVFRRLEQERQTLAGWQHPNISRILDLGMANGAIFVLSELVEDAAPLLDHCTNAKLSRHQRLELFTKICSAVSYGHQRLTVHGDLKPSNIVISSDGEPKVQYFGLFNMIGAAPVSIPTDIYALGRLLDEILTTGSKKRIPADLTAIVAKATNPDPAARYPSVEQFAADIHRYLHMSPVLAREGTWKYVAWKFAVRNKLAAFVGVVAMAVIVGLAWAAIQAEIRRYKMDEQLRETRAMAGMMAMYIPGRIEEIPGSLSLRRKMISYGLDYLDQQTHERDPADLKQRRQLAIGYFDVANALGGPGVSNLGEFAEAAKCYRKALDLLFEGEPPLRPDQQILSTIAFSLMRQTELLLRNRQPQQAMQAAEECIAHTSKSGDPIFVRTELTCRSSRLRALADMGKAVSDTEVADLIERELELEGKNGSPVARAANIHLAARLSLQRKDYPKALEQAISGLDVMEKLNRSGFLSVHRARLLVIAAKAETALGNAATGPARFSECFDVMRELVRKQPVDVEFRNELAVTLVESLEYAEEDRIRIARLAEAEELVRGILKETAYPAAQFVLVRILAAQADLSNNCELRSKALAEFEKIKSSGHALPLDSAYIEPIQAKACAAAAKQP